MHLHINNHTRIIKCHTIEIRSGVVYTKKVSRLLLYITTHIYSCQFTELADLTTYLYFTFNIKASSDLFLSQK